MVVAKRKREDQESSLLREDVSLSRLDTPFPRGGGSDLAPIEIKRAEAEAARDVYNEMKKAKKPKRTAKKAAQAKDAPRVDPLILSKIKLGTLVLGYVTGVHQSLGELVVSLPNNLTGYCSAEFLDLSIVGTYLRFVVTGLGEPPKRRLQLSYDPELANQTLSPTELTEGLAVQGVVESVEEKGVLLNLGASLGHGFLPSKSSFMEDQPVLAFVKNGEKRIKQLTSSTSVAVVAVLNQPALVPGSLVASAPVERETTLGNVYELVSSTTASSDVVHSLGDISKSPAVRVVFSYPPTQINGDRQLGVSIRSHIVSLGKSESSTAPGDLVKVTVQSVKPSVGIFVKSGDEDGFIHISQLKSEGDIDLEQEPRFAPGTEHEARVLGMSHVDGLSYLSLDPDILAQRYMSIADVKIGDVIENATVDRFLSKGGVLIRLSKGIIGIANEQQLSDVPLKNPELKFKQGQRVSVRVLDVDAERHRVELTLKKSIVTDSGPIIDGYEVVENAVGTVFRLSERGAKLVFFGGVKGWLPASEMLETSANPEKLFRLGQTVRVRVLEADASCDRLIVSARPNSELGEHIGQIFDSTVTIRSKNEVRVSINGLGEAALVGKPKVSTGDKLRVKVLSERLVTSDPALVDAALPRDVDDLIIGQELSGYVAGSQPNTGVFVSFMGGLTGLLPSNALRQDAWPPVGKVLTVKVDNVDFTRNRFYLSLPDTGKKVSAVITSVKQTQLNITVNSEQGRIDVSQLFSSLEEIPDPKNPLAGFHEGETIDDLTIMGRHDARTHKFLPLSHRGGVHALLELSRVPALKLTEGSYALAFVNNVSDDGEALWVSLSTTVKARMSLVDLTTDAEQLKCVKTNFPIGSALRVKILKAGPKPVLTALESESDLALVSSIDTFKLTVRLPNHKTAEISAVDTADEIKPLKKVFERNQIVRFRKFGNRVTLRSSEPPAIAKDAVVQGIVKNVAPGGLFVLIAPNKVGRAQIGQLSDTYLKNWQSYKKVGDIVTAKILEIKADGKIEISLKPSVVTGQKQPNIGKVEVDKSYRGVIRRIERFGVFVDFAEVTGMCHISDISENPIDDLSRVFKVGDSVRVKVLSKDEEKQQIALGMKASYFNDDDDDDEHDEDLSNGSDEIESENSDAMDGEDDVDSDLDTLAVVSGKDNVIYASDSDEDEESDDSGSDSESSPDSEDNGDGLSAGFSWTGDIPDAKEAAKQDSEASESEDDDEPRLRSKKRKQADFVKDETATMQTRLPQSAKDFERLIVSNPNSSMLWMNYMAFQLQLSEIELARSIAHRALGAINVREEEEKMNIWVALLNLEVQFGTPDSIDKAFRESQQYMDSLTMHLKMANVYSQAGKLNEAREIYTRSLKRFGADSLELWLSAMKFYFTDGEDKAAGRALADRALQRLPQREQLEFTKQFAILEFELGDAERGRTLFEALLASKPRRVDVWNVYIDQELKHADEQRWSGLFERVLANKITMKQAKFFFKKWINVAGDQEYVKARAKEYVASHEEGRAENEN